MQEGGRRGGSDAASRTCGDFNVNVWEKVAVKVGGVTDGGSGLRVTEER